MKKTFRIISLLEGVSFILLLFIATPIKYYAENDSFVKMLGMPHGLLFLVYVVFAILLKYELKWNSKTFWVVIFASVIPFGTFYIDKKYLKN
jgi:integral membrane protein